MSAEADLGRRPSAPPTRRLMLALPWLGAALLASCAEAPGPPAVFPPLNFDYLTKLRLNVATIDVENAWTPSTVPGGQHVEALAPVSPADALRLMAQQRLIPAGGDGHAVFVIEDASIVQFPDRFDGNMQVHLDVASADGTKAGYAEARVSRTLTIVDRSADSVRAAMYDLVRQLMTDMNVEFEFQVRRSLHDYLQPDAGTAPPPAPVEQQDLNGAPAATPPTAPDSTAAPEPPPVPAVPVPAEPASPPAQ